MDKRVHCEACGEQETVMFGIRNDRARKLFPTIVFRDTHTNLVCAECLKKAERRFRSDQA